MKKAFFDRRLWLIIAVLWTLFIWSNSLQTAAESSQHSSGVLEILAPLLFWTGLPEAVWHTLIRKMAHMMEFGLLGLLWSTAFGMARKPLGWAMIICLLTAFVDETIQLFVPGRSGELRDVGIDFIGALLGGMIAAAISRVKR